MLDYKMYVYVQMNHCITVYNKRNFDDNAKILHSVQADVV